jgi:2-polyprenyl-6-methoxyphenol hydroxylase-like FAD-dependent oxidoreductase
MTGESRTGGQDTNRETQRERRDRPETAGCAHERQVLVVGEDPPAIATAGFLSQVGLDPVLARPPSERAGPNTLTLWRPGLVLLERLGLRRPVEAIGTRLDRLARPNVNSSWTTDQSDRPALLSVRRAELLSLLDRRVRDRIRTPERPIVDIDRSQDRVDATFEGGIEESFDTVVTTDSTLAPTVEPRHVVATTHTWAFDWPTEPPAPDGPTERWKGDRAAFSVPVADGTRVRLVSVTDPTCAATDVDSLERQFGAVLGWSANSFETLSQHGIQYHQGTRAVPVSVHADGVVLITSAARVSLPGGCLRTTLGIEDAWVLADALAYGPRDRDDALNEYEQRRRRRERELDQCSTTTTPTVQPSIDLSPVLSRLCARRALAFRHVTSGHLPDVAKSIPASL